MPSSPVANKPLVVAIRLALVWRSLQRAAAVNEVARLGVPVVSRVLVIARRLLGVDEVSPKVTIVQIATRYLLLNSSISYQSVYL
jgi:hypothetical protein